MSEGVNIYPPFAACDDVTRLWWNGSPRSQRIISEKLSTMSGVCQTGTFATLHRVKAENLPQMERDLKAFSAGHPIALVLPALYSEFGGNAMPLIREELCKVHCLSGIVVTLGQASEEQFREAQGFLADVVVKVRKTLLWTLAAEGAAPSDGALKALQTKCIRIAEDTISYHHADARINGLCFDRNEEEKAVAAFAKGLEMACELLEQSNGYPTDAKLDPSRRSNPSIPRTAC